MISRDFSITCLTISVGGPAQAPATPTSRFKVNPKITVLVSKRTHDDTPLLQAPQAFSRNPGFAGTTTPMFPRGVIQVAAGAAPEDFIYC